MLSNMFSALLVPTFLLSSLVSAAVDVTTVGPATPLSSKSKVCNVLDYGAVADNSTDIGPAILSAFTSCAKAGGATIYVPPGSYSIATGVVLNKGTAFAMQIDGLITLTSDGAFNGNAILIENSNDVEVFSSNGLGAINGQGYITRLTDSSQNARLFRFITCSEMSFHDIILVDSPTFHLVLNDVSNAEAYHVTIRGPDIGGTDGIDIICTDNCYLHDLEVTNRDECISVKSPSNNILLEDIYCNHSGGMSIGSLTADITDSADAAAVSNITMRNIYVFECTQMLMIKTFPGGTGATGYVKDSVFENFWAYDTTYGLDIDQYWESHTTPDTGAVALSGLTFNNWTGTVDNGVSRGPIIIRGSDIVPITDITLTNFNMWTVNENKVVNQCKNVYGTGYCAGTSTGSDLATFTTSVTTTVTPTAYVAPTSPAWGVSGYGTTDPIPVYTPAAFWTPVSAGVASASGAAAVTTAVSSVAAAKKAASTASQTSLEDAEATVAPTSKVSSVSVVISSSVSINAAPSSSASISTTAKLSRTKASTSLATASPSTLATLIKSISSSAIGSSFIPVTADLNPTILPSAPILSSSSAATTTPSSTAITPGTRLSSGLGGRPSGGLANFSGFARPSSGLAKPSGGFGVVDTGDEDEECDADE